MNPIIFRTGEINKNRKIKYLYFATTLSIVFFLVFTFNVSAEENIPKWMQTLDCKDENQHFSGLEYCQGKSPYNNIHVIVIKLDNPGIKVEYVIAKGVDGGDEIHECGDVNRSTKQLQVTSRPGCNDPNDPFLYPVFSLNTAITDAKSRFPGVDLAFMINGDYSACTLQNDENCRYGIEYRDHGPEGLTVVRGDRLDGPAMGDGDDNAVNRPWLGISNTTPLIAKTGKFDSDDGYLPEEWDWIYTGVGGAPRLIFDGDIIKWEIKYCSQASGSCYPGASQTAVGLTEDEDWLFFVIAENQNTLIDLAKFMHNQLDCWQAIKFDGGGSSKMWYDGKTIIAGDERMLTNYLAITAKRGSGINLGSSSIIVPSPTPPAELSIIERIIKLWTWIIVEWQVLLNSINNLRQEIEEFGRTWKVFQQNIKSPEWWSHVITDWIKKCLGNILIPSLMALIIYAKKRQPNKARISEKEIINVDTIDK